VGCAASFGALAVHFFAPKFRCFMNSPPSNRVLIMDTTLRDGEQSPGASMNKEQKLQVAHALRDLGVDILEVGFPVSSPGDFDSVQTIARKIEGATICGLCRCHPKDIPISYEALKDTPRRRLHLFLATSPLHREFKLQMDKAEVIRRSVEAIERARELFDDVQFSTEDGSRTELDYLCEVVEKAIEAGATTLNIPDTVGYTTPEEYANCFRCLKEHVRGIDKVVLSVHCHNDLGMAVANSLMGLKAGARQVECVINGIGERAGNAALEEVVMALRTRRDFWGLETGIKTERLYPTSRLISSITGLTLARNKAIVGQNAFAHEAGIHQHGMLCHSGTYEIMRPEDVGISKTHLVLGKHSGRHSLRQRLLELGFSLSDEQLDAVFADFKLLADKKKEVFDADLEALVSGRIAAVMTPAWELESYHLTSSTQDTPAASVTLKHRSGLSKSASATGEGSVEAVYQAIGKATGISVRLKDYQVSAVTVGEDALGYVTVEILHGTQTYVARSVSIDVIEASTIAFLDAINRIAALLEDVGEKKVER